MKKTETVPTQLFNAQPKAPAFSPGSSPSRKHEKEKAMKTRKATATGDSHPVKQLSSTSDRLTAMANGLRADSSTAVFFGEREPQVGASLPPRARAVGPAVKRPDVRGQSRRNPLRIFPAILIAASFAPTVVAAEPKGDEAKKPTSAEIRMAVQQICPVSGQKLGEHGKPIAVKIGKEQVFLCCKGCTTGKVKPEHWATIHVNFAKAQRICPVMKHDLPKGAKWTIVEGRVVYVCCPPCIKKIEAEPKAYLKAVDELYLASLKKRKESEAKAKPPAH